MNHKGTKQLETDRLILRKFEFSDYKEMYNNWANDERVAQYLSWKAHKNEEETKLVIDMWIKEYDQPSSYNWAIYLKDEKKVIGSISVINQDEDIKTCEIGYCMGYAWWGKGIMPEAANKVLSYLFEEIGYNRIEAKHNKKNPKSGRVMQKIGMTYEGTLRERIITTTGEFDDAIQYSILKNEFEQKKEIN